MFFISSTRTSSGSWKDLQALNLSHTYQGEPLSLQNLENQLCMFKFLSRSYFFQTQMVQLFCARITRNFWLFPKKACFVDPKLEDKIEKTAKLIVQFDPFWVVGTFWLSSFFAVWCYFVVHSPFWHDKVYFLQFQISFCVCLSVCVCNFLTVCDCI